LIALWRAVEDPSRACVVLLRLLTLVASLHVSHHQDSSVDLNEHLHQTRRGASGWADRRSDPAFLIPLLVMAVSFSLRLRPCP